MHIKFDTFMAVLEKSKCIEFRWKSLAYYSPYQHGDAIENNLESFGGLAVISCNWINFYRIRHACIPTSKNYVIAGSDNRLSHARQ